MIRVILVFLFCLGGVSWTNAAQDDLASRLSRRLEQRPVLRAEFVQEKHMAAFRKPLVTRGRLSVVRGQGVLWMIESPLNLTYVLTDDRIVEIGEDGKAQSRAAQDVQGLAQVGRIFRGLLSGQTATLKEVFDLTMEGSLEAWQLVLTPKPGPLGQYLRQIQLQGGRYVDRIRIEEARGDTTTIRFRNNAEAEAPSPEERSRLGGN